MKQFQGRVICPGTCEAEALVSHGGFNTLASYQMALMFHDKQVKCGDQNNPDLYKKPMIGKALCLPETIGSTTGGMVLYTACASGQQPACMLFSKHIDSLAASGAILASVWTDADMPVIDCLGDEFLAAVQTGQTVRVLDGGVVEVACLLQQRNGADRPVSPDFACSAFLSEMAGACAAFSLRRRQQALFAG